MRRADLAVTEQFEALFQDLLELLLRAALQEHVPVRTHRLLDLGLGVLDRDVRRLGSAPLTLPQRGHVSLVGHGHLEAVSLRAHVGDLLATGELNAPLVLEALAPKTCSTQRTLCHLAPPRPFC